MILHILPDPGCQLVHCPATYHSQSEEDRALYQRYFSKPDVFGGVYLEIGALDGVSYSNTKFFEDHLKWSGILIEANPENAALLKRNRPKSLVIPKAVCNASEKFVEFAGSAAVGGILKEMPSSHIHRFIPDKRTIKVPCEPIGQMIRDSGFRANDLFVLDVEGAELMVLRTMDWSIPVRVFVVEMGRGDKDRQLVNLLHQQGYRNATWNIRDYCRPGKDCANDMVFENTQFIYQISS